MTANQTADSRSDTVTRTVQAAGVVTREVDGEETDLIRVPISSTRADREGDRFDKAALEDMADQVAVQNPMVFDNHGLAGSYVDAIPYDSRETIGALMEAELESAEDGEWDLYATVNPDGTHPEGERLAKQVRDEGQPIKFSVGFRVKGYDEREEVESDYEGDGRVFTAADLMETSRVGIPANPDASVTQSVTAKDGLPGYSNHPMVQMFHAMNDGTTGDPEREGVVAKDATESTKGSCEVDADCPDGEVCVDGECVPEDDDDDDDEEDDTCPDCEHDIPEGASYCPNCGASLDAGDPEETDSATIPEEVQDELDAHREAHAELRAEIEALREDGLGRGEGKSTDPDMTPDTTADSDTEDDEPADKDAGSGLLFD